MKLEEMQFQKRLVVAPELTCPMSLFILYYIAQVIVRQHSLVFLQICCFSIGFLFALQDAASDKDEGELSVSEELVHLVLLLLAKSSVFLHFYTCLTLGGASIFPQFSFALEISAYGFSTSGKNSVNNFFSLKIFFPWKKTCFVL